MRGFTLLEVLVALLVVSITLAAANAAVGVPPRARGRSNSAPSPAGRRTTC